MSNLNLNPISDSPPRPSAPGSTETRLEIDATRARQTERPATPFRSVLAGGVSLLMSGAEVATHVVGGPVLAAAVHDARVGATNVIAGTAGAGPAGLASPPAALAAAAGASGGPATANVDDPDAAGSGFQPAAARLANAGAAGEPAVHDRLERHAREARHGEGRRFEHPRLTC